MRTVVNWAIIALALPAIAQELLELRLGTVAFQVPSSWHFEQSGKHRATGRGPDGASVIANYEVLLPDAPPEATAKHVATVRGFAAEKMPGLADKNGTVIRPVTEQRLPGERVQYSSASQSRRGDRDYYFLQYLFGSNRSIVYMTIEGFGRADAAATSFDRIALTQQWRE
jgi:hypothetical protein